MHVVGDHQAGDLLFSHDALGQLQYLFGGGGVQCLSLIHIFAFLILAFTPVTSLIYRIIFGIAIVGDLLYLCLLYTSRCV